MRIRSVSKIPVRGRRVSPEAIHDWDRITPAAAPSIDEWLARRLLAGMHPKAAAVAHGSISVRTAYRWRRALVALEIVEVGGLQATYAIRRNGPPARLTRWTKAA